MKHHLIPLALVAAVSMGACSESPKGDLVTPPDPSFSVIDIGQVVLSGVTVTQEGQLWTAPSCAGYSSTAVHLGWSDMIDWDKGTDCFLTGGGSLDGGQVAVFAYDESDWSNTQYLGSFSGDWQGVAQVLDIDQPTGLFLRASPYPDCHFWAWFHPGTNVWDYWTGTDLRLPADGPQSVMAFFVCPNGGGPGL